MSSHSDSFVRSGNSPTRSVPKNLPDFLVEDHGSIFLLIPLNDYAQAWVKDNLDPGGSFQPYFPTAVVIEHRYISDIVQGIRNDGLAVR